MPSLWVGWWGISVGWAKVDGVAKKASGGQEGRERLFVVVTGEPHLAPIRRVNLRVVPAQLPACRSGAALRRAHRFLMGWRTHVRPSRWERRCRTTTGGVVRHRIRSHSDGGSGALSWILTRRNWRGLANRGTMRTDPVELGRNDNRIRHGRSESRTSSPVPGGNAVRSGWYGWKPSGWV